MKTLFRCIAALEGLSYFYLLCVGVPYKYIYDNPTIVEDFGMMHGVFFVLYCIMAYMVKDKYKWTNKQTIWVLFLSIIPLGTFFGDYFYFRKKAKGFKN